MASRLSSALKAGVFSSWKISLEFTVKALIGGSDFVGDMGMYISFLHTPNEFLHRVLMVGAGFFLASCLYNVWVVRRLLRTLLQRDEKGLVRHILIHSPFRTTVVFMISLTGPENLNMVIDYERKVAEDPEVQLYLTEVVNTITVGSVSAKMLEEVPQMGINIAIFLLLHLLHSSADEMHIGPITLDLQTYSAIKLGLSFLNFLLAAMGDRVKECVLVPVDEESEDAEGIRSALGSLQSRAPAFQNLARPCKPHAAQLAAAAIGFASGTLALQVAARLLQLTTVRDLNPLVWRLVCLVAVPLALVIVQAAFHYDFMHRHRGVLQHLAGPSGTIFFILNRGVLVILFSIFLTPLAAQCYNPCSARVARQLASLRDVRLWCPVALLHCGVLAVYAYLLGKSFFGDFPGVPVLFPIAGIGLELLWVGVHYRQVVLLADPHSGSESDTETDSGGDAGKEAGTEGSPVGSAVIGNLAATLGVLALAAMGLSLVCLPAVSAAPEWFLVDGFEGPAGAYLNGRYNKLSFFRGMPCYDHAGAEKKALLFFRRESRDNSVFHTLVFAHSLTAQSAEGKQFRAEATLQSSSGGFWAHLASVWGSASLTEGPAVQLWEPSRSEPRLVHNVSVRRVNSSTGLLEEENGRFVVALPVPMAGVNGVYRAQVSSQYGFLGTYHGEEVSGSAQFSNGRPVFERLMGLDGTSPEDRYRLEYSSKRGAWFFLLPGSEVQQDDVPKYSTTSPGFGVMIGMADGAWHLDSTVRKGTVLQLPSALSVRNESVNSSVCAGAEELSKHGIVPTYVRRGWQLACRQGYLPAQRGGLCERTCADYTCHRGWRQKSHPAARLAIAEHEHDACCEGPMCSTYSCHAPWKPIARREDTIGSTRSECCEQHLPRTSPSHRPMLSSALSNESSAPSNESAAPKSETSEMPVQLKTAGEGRGGDERSIPLLPVVTVLSMAAAAVAAAWCLRRHAWEWQRLAVCRKLRGVVSKLRGEHSEPEELSDASDECSEETGTFAAFWAKQQGGASSSLSSEETSSSLSSDETLSDDAARMPLGNVYVMEGPPPARYTFWVAVFGLLQTSFDTFIAAIVLSHTSCDDWRRNLLPQWLVLVCIPLGVFLVHSAVHYRFVTRSLQAPQPLDLVVAYASFALTPLAAAWYGVDERRERFRWEPLARPAACLRLFAAALYLLTLWQTFFEVPTRLLCLGLVLNSAWLGLHLEETLVTFGKAVPTEDWHREAATRPGSSKRGRRAVLVLCAASAALIATGLVVIAAAGQRRGLVVLSGLPQSALQRSDDAFDGVFRHAAFYEGLPAFARTGGEPALLFFRHAQSVEHDDSVLVLARSFCAQRCDWRAEQPQSLGGKAKRVLRILPSFLNFEDTLCLRNRNSLGNALFGMRNNSGSEGRKSECSYMAFKTFREVTGADESGWAKSALNFGNQGFEQFLALAQREGTWHVWDQNSGVYAIDQAWNITVDVPSPMVQLQELCRECGAEADAFARSSLQQQVLPNRTQEGHSPLSIAARHGCAPVAGVLMDEGADVNQTDSNTGASPLWIAAKFGHGKVSEMLLQQGADISQEAKDTGLQAPAMGSSAPTMGSSKESGPLKGTPLWIAAAWSGRQGKRTTAVDVLLQHNADIAPGLNGMTPLHVAARFYGSAEAAAALLKARCAVNAKSKQDETPLQLAVTSSYPGRVAVARVLLANGANASLPFSNTEWTPLAFSCQKGREVGMAQALIEGRADVDQQARGRSPLYIASQEGNIEAAELLLARRANVHLGVHGTTPVQAANRSGHGKLAELLLHHGAGLPPRREASARAPERTTAAPGAAPSTSAAPAQAGKAAAALEEDGGAMPSTSVAPAQAGTAAAALEGAGPAAMDMRPLLFCFLVMMRNGSEPGLVSLQLDRGIGVFACDGRRVFCEGPSVNLTGSAGSIATSPIGNMTERKGLSQQGASTSSWLNAGVFLEVWSEIGRQQEYDEYNWTVKVDPDTVFLPHRLRTHLVRMSATCEDSGSGCYVANCQSEGFHLFGSLEVLSTSAVSQYVEGMASCRSALEWFSMGEDSFLQGCLDFLGVSAVQGDHFIADKACASKIGSRLPSCSSFSAVAFHPFPREDEFLDCLYMAGQIHELPE